MTIDIGVGVIVLVFALLGLASGFWSQILRLGALASLFFIAPPVARAIEGPVKSFMSDGVTPRAVAGASLIVAAVGLYLVMSLIIWLLVRALRGDRPMSGTNRALGFFLGLVKGGALCYFILAGLVLVQQSSYYSAQLEGQGWWVKNAGDSKLVEIVAEHNLLVEMGYELPTPDELRRELEEYGVDASDLPVQVPGGTGAPAQTTPEAMPAGGVAPVAPGGMAPSPGGQPMGPGGQPMGPGGQPMGPGGTALPPGQNAVPTIPAPPPQPK